MSLFCSDPSHRRGRSAKRDQILEAAAEVFLELGFAGASMDEITRRAGVSKATVYAHFTTKEELFGSIIRVRTEREGALEIAPEIYAQGPEAALRAIARRFLELLYSAEVVQVFRVVVAESHRFPELGRVFYANGPRATWGRLSAYLAEETKAGRLAVEDCDFAAQGFVYRLRGDLHFRMVLGLEPPGIENHESEATKLIDLAIGDFLARHRRDENNP